MPRAPNLPILKLTAEFIVGFEFDLDFILNFICLTGKLLSPSLLHFKIKPASDRAIYVSSIRRWPEASSSERVLIQKQIRNWHTILKPKIKQFRSISEVSDFEILSSQPAYDSLLITYDPLRMRVANLVEFLSNHQLTKDESLVPGRLLNVPVCYDLTLAEDLGEALARLKMKLDDFIECHTKPTYQVLFLGFMPGFPYLSGLPETLQLPRRSQPRLQVPKGSVAIGGAQTGIYSLESPGGWNIIGRTPLHFFKPENTPPVLVECGDQIKFRPISLDEFKRNSSDAHP